MVALLARTVVIVICLAASVGCVSHRDRAVVAANAAGDIGDGMHEVIAHRYQAALEDCLTLPTRQHAEACGHGVNDRYEPLWRGYRALRAAWLVLAASVQAIDLLGEDVSDAELLAQMVTLGEAVKELQRAVVALGEDHKP